MESIKKQNDDDDTIFAEDKCDNCGDTNADKYWDFKDKSVLCDKCYEKMGDEWENRNSKINHTKKIKCDICDKDFASSEALESHNNSKHKKKHNTFSNKKMSGKTIAIVSAISLIALIFVSFGIFGHISSNESNTNANVVTSQGSSNIANLQDNVQTATLRVSRGTYILEPSTLKKDIPVKIVVNYNSLTGCSKTIAISSFSIMKRITAIDNVITFTPTKTGTFKIACSMDMYRGTFTVE